MDINNLVHAFLKFDTEQLDNYKNMISSKNSRGIYPPYIPYVGGRFRETGLLFYAMAQNIKDPWPELKQKNKREKVLQLYNAKNFEDIAISPYSVMLALAGIYLYATRGLIYSSFDQIHGCIAATNYYKFSLHDKNGDINPNYKLDNPSVYWEINDQLVHKELDCLKPTNILSFNGRHVEILKTKRMKVECINDPAWILKGHGGTLKPNGEWDRKIKDETAIHLVNSYINQIKDKYAVKKEAVKIYLLKYFDDWGNKNKKKI
jgi:hypothetical protein